LTRIWAKVPEAYLPLRDEALELVTQIDVQERLWLHWGMALLTHPFFRDVAATVGQLSRLQGTFSYAQVERRMIESWGQRTTLQRASRRVVNTFVAWGVLQDTGAGTRSDYSASPPRHTQDQALALWLMDCALKANQAEQVLLGELGRLSYTFPFDLLPCINAVHHSKRFEVTRQGLNLEMVAAACGV
jgi:hypothetical protein